MKQGQWVMMAALALLLAKGAAGSQQSFEIDLKELDAVRKSGPAPRHKARPAKAKPAASASAQPAVEGDFLLYTVKPGDHIFKILMRDFQLSNAAAERLIPEIGRINKVADIRRLSVGQTLRIPKSLVPSAASARAAEPAPPAAAPAKPAAVADVEPATLPVSSVEPAPSEKSVEAAPPVVPASAPPAMVPVGSVLAITVNGGDPQALFLRLAEVLRLKVQHQRVIESGGGTAERFSIKVPLYAEGGGKRLIVTVAGQDPYQYTLFRLLETEGYLVLQFREADGFREVTASTLVKLGQETRLGRYRLINGKEQEVLGYLLNSPEGMVLLTDAPVGGIWTAVQVGEE